MEEEKPDALVKPALGHIGIAEIGVAAGDAGVRRGGVGHEDGLAAHLQAFQVPGGGIAGLALQDGQVDVVDVPRVQIPPEHVGHLHRGHREIPPIAAGDLIVLQVPHHAPEDQRVHGEDLLRLQPDQAGGGIACHGGLGRQGVQLPNVHIHRINRASGVIRGVDHVARPVAADRIIAAVQSRRPLVYTGGTVAALGQRCGGRHNQGKACRQGRGPGPEAPMRFRRLRLQDLLVLHRADGPE